MADTITIECSDDEEEEERQSKVGSCNNSGVPECIKNLAQTGLQTPEIYKKETAVNINGYSCGLLSKALVVDGKALEISLSNDSKDEFLRLVVGCAYVICCQVSPKQKTMDTRLVGKYTGNITLAIGDGSNDVGMIQAVDIGVGISGLERLQAIMASDFMMPQFRFLERLLLVHGHWCYKRISKMILYSYTKTALLHSPLKSTPSLAGMSYTTTDGTWSYRGHLYIYPTDDQLIGEMKYLTNDVVNTVTGEPVPVIRELLEIIPAQDS